MVVLAASAAAAEPGPSRPLALAITPALIDAEAAGGGPLPTISLTNRGTSSFRLTVVPALAGQALEGGLSLLRGRSNDALARRMFRLSAPRVVEPGATVEVQSLFLGFAGRRTVSAAAVITAVPLQRPRLGVTYRLRLLAALLVHRPNTPARPPSLDRVQATRSSPRRLQLTAHVRNRGSRVAFVTAVRFRLLNSSGRVLASVQGPPGFVLANSVRNISAGLSHRLPRGRLRVEALVRSGTRETRRSTFFTSR
jgi:hypothetical protein